MIGMLKEYAIIALKGAAIGIAVTAAVRAGHLIGGDNTPPAHIY